MEEYLNQTDSPELESEPGSELFSESFSEASSEPSSESFTEPALESFSEPAKESTPDAQSETRGPVRNRRRSIFPRTQQSVDSSGHMLEVLRAAMPYIDSHSQNTMETLLKATDLIHSTKNLSSPSAELSAASLNSKSMDLEGLLSSVRTVGSGQERDMIDKMLNYFKARKLYQTYMMFNQNKDTLKAASLGNQNNSGFGMNANFMEAMKSILPPDQAANLDTMSTLVNAMNIMNAMGMNNTNANSSNNNYSGNYNGNNNTQTNSTQMNQSASNRSNSNSMPQYAQNQYNSYNNNSNTYGYNQTNSDTNEFYQASPERTIKFPSVPNYTYNMSSGSNKEEEPTIDNEYMNQFTPDIKAASTDQYNSTITESPMPTDSSNHTAGGTQTPFRMDANSMNQLYNNINMIYNTLNAAGLNSNGTSNYNTNSNLNTNTNHNPNLNPNLNPNRNTNQNQRNDTANMQSMNPMYTQPNPQNNAMSNTNTSNTNNNNNMSNMFNAFTALANSGLLNKNNGARQNNLRSMPIPNANNFRQTSSSPETIMTPNAKSTSANKSFNPDEIYDRLSSYRNMNDWNHSGGSPSQTGETNRQRPYQESVAQDSRPARSMESYQQPDILEAASLDPH